MLYVVAVFGVLMCAAGIVGLVIPASLMAAVSWVVASKPLRITATIMRILFGAILIVAANSTLYPLALKIMGVITIMAGTVGAMTSGETLNRWIEKIGGNDNWTRLMSILSLGLGAFLVHAIS